MSLIRIQADADAAAESGRRLAQALKEISAAMRPGISTGELNRLALQTIERLKSEPVFLGYRGYPAAVCTSINEQVVHGIPSDATVLAEGDIMGIDLGLRYDGWISDAAITVGVGRISGPARRLIAVARQALVQGIKAARPGNRIGAIGAVIQAYVEKRGFGVVRDLSGHGVGRELHEEPTIPNFGSPDRGTEIKPGMIIAIEPMITAGDWHVRTLGDGWTVETLDRSLSAHFEHTVLITDRGARILTEA